MSFKASSQPERNSMILWLFQLKYYGGEKKWVKDILKYDPRPFNQLGMIFNQTTHL